ncbi:MAG: bacillithiol biosynthesis cysteine-adding enzyme BshC [Ferruginibacter sp.]|nr:bacillithiol biosynthesis cysteine-adding enzyme BshC [Ferruginibacter sp.]
MNSTASLLSYKQTGYFSKIVLDYIDTAEAIQPFISQQPTPAGIAAAIQARKNFKTNRQLLVDVLTKQYAEVRGNELVQANIQSLLSDNTFTICTAHQPNIFTGQLYFIYKILHTIKLAASLKTQIPENHFVPVYYMGSEDADLEELGFVVINGKKYEWKTDQTGAVGRMKVDQALVALLEEISGQLLVEPFGAEITELMKRSYSVGDTIEASTFKMVNELFAGFGLLILLPDNPALKRSYAPVIEKELFQAFSHKLVQETVTAFPADYKVQASGRELNMFYLSEGHRDRFEQVGDTWKIVNSDREFTREELSNELAEHPERFSPNVILRPALQEWILPNIAFIGGGGEIAYWLQLKRVFEDLSVPYPVLVVRNSFLFVSKEANALAIKLCFELPELFATENTLVDKLVRRDTERQISLEEEKKAFNKLYEEVKIIAGKVANTLANHTEALQQQGLKKLDALEKKLLRAEKKKFEAEIRQLNKLLQQLFPSQSLQERVDNLMPYYAKWGKDFIKDLYQHSLTLEQEFTVLTEA